MTTWTEHLWNIRWDKDRCNAKRKRKEFLCSRISLLVGRTIDAPVSIRVTANRNNVEESDEEREREREREREKRGSGGENFPKFANHSAPARCSARTATFRKVCQQK